MSALDTIIDLEFLKKHESYSEGMKYIEKEIREPIAAKDLINKFLATEEYEKIELANWLICELFTPEQALKYRRFSVEQISLPVGIKYFDNKRPRNEITEAMQSLSYEVEMEEYKKCIEAKRAANGEYSGYAAFVAIYASSLPD